MGRPAREAQRVSACGQETPSTPPVDALRHPISGFIHSLLRHQQHQSVRRCSKSLYRQLLFTLFHPPCLFAIVLLSLPKNTLLHCLPTHKAASRISIARLGPGLRLCNTNRQADQTKDLVRKHCNHCSSTKIHDLRAHHTSDPLKAVYSWNSREVMLL